MADGATAAWANYYATRAQQRNFRRTHKLYRPRQVWDGASGTILTLPGRRARGVGAYRIGSFRRRLGRRRVLPWRRTARRRLRGMGGYFGTGLGYLGRAAGNVVDWGLGGSNYGAKWGAGATSLGEDLEVAAFSKYMGNKYALAPNSRFVQDVPLIDNGGQEGCVRIVHKEYIGDVTSAGAPFTVLYNLAINPGNPATFPWLSQIANSFMHWRCNGMVFTFKSTSGALSTTQALGEVIMGTNYNVYEPQFQNKQQMLNEIHADSKVPANDMDHPIEVMPYQTTGTGLFMVRGTAVPAGQDQRFYDLADFQLATQGQSGTPTLGELWVSYDVCLYKPQMITEAISPLAPGAYSHYYSTTGLGNTTPFGTSGTMYNSDIPIVVGPTTITFNSTGTFMILMFFQNFTSAALTVGGLSWGSLTNVTQSYVNVWHGDTGASATTPPAGSTATGVSLSTCVALVPTGAPVTATMTMASCTGFAGAGSYCDIFVISLDHNV